MREIVKRLYCFPFCLLSVAMPLSAKDFNLALQNNTDYQLIAVEGTSEAYCEPSIPGVLPPSWQNPVLAEGTTVAVGTLLPVPGGYSDDMQCSLTTEFNPEVMIRFSVSYYNSGDQKNELCVKTLGCNRLILSYGKMGSEYDIGIHLTQKSQSCIPTTKPYCLPTV